MKFIFLCSLLQLLIFSSIGTAVCQEPPSPSKKELKRGFRRLQRKAPDRAAKKMLRHKKKEYLSLLDEYDLYTDSINQQKAEIERIQEELQEAKKIIEPRLETLRKENDSLKEIMRAYVKSIDSLNSLNEQLADAQNNTADYYFNLADFEKPKIYYYVNTSNPASSHYWRIYSIPDSNLLITEAFDSKFEQFEVFVEHYDSLGSKVIQHISINRSDSIESSIGDNDVYRWNLDEKYAYTIYYGPDEKDYSYTKKRQFGSVANMEILGEKVTVLRFQDKYTFFSEGFIVFEQIQQSFYSKEYGLVRFLRVYEENQENETFLLKEIMSDQEWQELTK